ncbi:hypothetical protein SFC23_16825 [Shouchella clausii]|uniref:hypothetical protein n=1 Tax=Shouchella clausii TaxID=79880 RepID=UPI003982E83C
MKKLLVLFCITSMIVLFIPVVSVYAQTESFTQEEVEKLIEEKLGKEQPLTQGELTKALLEFKDEKIENLEGNLSKVIDTIAAYIGIASLILVIIGWLFKRNIDDKLTTIEIKEATIKGIQQDIENKFKLISSYHNKIKLFAGEIKETNKKLINNSKLLTETIADVEGLRNYVGTIEEITNSSILIYKFLIEQSQSKKIIKDTYDLIEKPQKNPNLVLREILSKLELDANMSFNNTKELKEFVDVLVTSLNEEEDDFFTRLEYVDSVIKEHVEYDEEDIKLLEELSDTYKKWTCSYDSILIIKNYWDAQLKLNSTKENDS